MLITHYRPYEEIFIKNGFGIRRYNLMYNDFVIIGPKDDPAEIKIGDTTVKQTEDFTYLGSKISNKGRSCSEIRCRIHAWNFCGSWGSGS